MKSSLINNNFFGVIFLVTWRPKKISSANSYTGVCFLKNAPKLFQENKNKNKNLKSTYLDNNRLEKVNQHIKGFFKFFFTFLFDL